MSAQEIWSGGSRWPDSGDAVLRQITDEVATGRTTRVDQTRYGSHGAVSIEGQRTKWLFGEGAPEHFVRAELRYDQRYADLADELD